MQEWLENNNILMYFTHNEDKLLTEGKLLTERFIKTLKAIKKNDS